METLASRLDDEPRGSRRARRIALLSWLVTLVALTGCEDVTCDELREDYADELNQIREVCRCSFEVECDPDNSSGRNAVTIRRPDGQVLCRFAGGEEEIPEQVVEHELIHAADLCIRASESASPPDDGVEPNLSEVLLESLLMEFVAFDVTGPLDAAQEPTPGFPDPDRDDASLRSAFDSLNSVLAARLRQEQLEQAFELLEAMGLGPDAIRADNPVYQNLKRILRERADSTKQAIGTDCIDEILDLL